MKLEAKREQLLKPLQHVIGAVERRQTLPILTHVLITARERDLTLTATDLEVELSVRADLPADAPGAITLPARKLHDILRALPEDGTVTLNVDGEKAAVRCGRSRFTLSVLPAADFPTLEDLPFEGDIRLPQGALRNLIERTHFAMAQQDVRYYLNGLLLEVSPGLLRVVATDGHRLAFQELPTEVDVAETRQVIVPRKGVLELMRLLADNDAAVALRLGANHVRLELGDIRMTSKLIDGKFPDYQRVIPREGSRVVIADRVALRNALTRTSLVLSDKTQGIRLQLDDWILRTQAQNPEQEEAEEEVEINYSGGSLEIGFNGSYLLDALGALGGELAKLSFADAGSSCLIEEAEGGGGKHVIMPMRL
ncbi:MAG: DNA polymerase III subunit beta [Candidatus Competibacter sp.]|nr:DNA polymerase III subunit beta [Candidatus Competibacter sp.]MDG4606230.1 DNA polymerase III subunit beta [Candidatus Contendobacter sp.]HRD50414.1 DNA polymerase III subunit beta [Candidatus Contendobacter sp.]